MAAGRRPVAATNAGSKAWDAPAVATFHAGRGYHYPMPNAKTKAWISLVVSFSFMAAMIFLSAGTTDYWQAWVYLAVVAVTSIPLTLLITQSPRLLEARRNAGPGAEKRPVQKLIVSLSGLPAIAAFIVPGLDHRFNWSNVPSWLVIAGDLLVVFGMWMVRRVFKENSFGSATVAIAEDQKVISTGPYAIVRHPMYASAMVYTVGMALALGSYWGLLAAFLIVLCLIWRLFDEEKLLVSKLCGYKEYRARVRWRLVPGVF